MSQNTQTDAQKEAEAKAKAEAEAKAKAEAEAKANAKAKASSKDKAGSDKEVITVKCRKPRRRAGLRFGPEPTEIKLSDITKDQLAALEADDHLTIRDKK